MITSKSELNQALAQNVSVSDEALIVDLEDGRTVATPLAWFPRLVHGSSSERENWRLIGHGEGIHWPELDEDISVESLLAGLSQRPHSKQELSYHRSTRPIQANPAVLVIDLIGKELPMIQEVWHEQRVSSRAIPSNEKVATLSGGYICASRR